MSAPARLDPTHCQACGSSHLYLRLVGPFARVWDGDQRELRLPKRCIECGADFVVIYELAAIERLPVPTEGPPW